MTLKSSVAEDKLQIGSAKCHVINKHDSLFLQVLKTNDGVGIRFSAKYGLNYFLFRRDGESLEKSISLHISNFKIQAYHLELKCIFVFQNPPKIPSYS